MPNVHGARRRNALAPRAQAQRAKTTNDPLSRWSGHTPEGRRVRDLFRAYWQALGSPQDVGTQAEILRAAELTILAEIKRMK
jgi:hypothetical protein